MRIFLKKKTKVNKNVEIFFQSINEVFFHLILNIRFSGTMYYQIQSYSYNCSVDDQRQTGHTVTT